MNSSIIPSLSNEQLALMSFDEKLIFSTKILLRKFPFYAGLFSLFALTLFVPGYLLYFIGPTSPVVRFIIEALFSGAFLMGILSLILKDIKGEDYKSVLKVLLEPFLRIHKITIPIVFWCLVGFLFLVATFYISRVPFLGWIVAMPMPLFLMTFLLSMFFYFADHKKFSIEEAISGPFDVACNNFDSWGSSIIAAGIAYFPSFMINHLFIGQKEMEAIIAALNFTAANPIDMSIIISLSIVVVLGIVGTTFFASTGAVDYLQCCARMAAKAKKQQLPMN